MGAPILNLTIQDHNSGYAVTAIKLLADVNIVEEMLLGTGVALEDVILVILQTCMGMTFE